MAGVRSADAVSLLTLALACAALRAPGLSAGDLNMDESAYQASASYLLATGRSAFSLFNLGPTVAVYKAAGAAFAPYTMLPLRLLALLIGFAIAALHYLLVSRAASGLAGLASGLVFVHLAQFFEGASVNREWFSNILLLAGLAAGWVARERALSHGGRLMTLAGAAGAAAVWFKEQTFPVVAAFPAYLVADALLRRSGSGLPRELLLYGTGCLLALGAYVGLLWTNGGLEGYLSFSHTYFRGYVQANEAAVRTGARDQLVLYIRAFLCSLPGRAFFAISYGMAVAALLRAALAARRRSDWRAPDQASFRLALLLAAYLVTCMLSVQMGSRFFGHYYLLMTPAVAALFGIAAHALLQRSTGDSWAGRIAGLLCLGTLLVSIGPAGPMFLGLDVHAKPAASLLLQLLGWPGVLALGALAIVVLRVHPGLPLRRPLGAVLSVAVALLVVQSHRLKPLTPFWFSRVPRLVQEIRARHSPSDRLFVWGWAPGIYSLTRVEAASEITLPQVVVSDYSRTPVRPTIEPRYAAILMRDLRERTPRFIVDAGAVGITLADGGPDRYRLGQYPDFELNRLLQERYELVGRFNRCKLYVLTLP